MSERDHLALLLKVNTILNSSESLDDVLKELIANVIETLNAERGFVVLREGESWQSAAAHHVRGPERETPYSRTVVEKVAETGTALVTLDALVDPRTRKATSVQRSGLLSILCAPLFWAGEVRGVVYADSRVRTGIFRDPERQILEAIAAQASRALEMAALHQTLQRIHRESLDRVEAKELEDRVGPVALDGILELMDTSGKPSAPVPETTFAGPLQIRLFGSLEVIADGLPVTSWKSRKDREVFIYLALHPGKIVHEDVLIELFWSRGGKKARHSLHNSITQIRKTIGDSKRSLLQREGDGYTLSEDCWIDARAFEKSFLQGRRAAKEGRWESALLDLRRAEKLAEKELLSDSRQEWILPIRFKTSQQLTDCRSLMAQYFSERGKHLMAVELWKRVLDHDNCSEDAYRGLMEANRALDRRAEMVKTYQACVKAYEEELDLPPPAEFEAMLDF